MDKLYRFAFWAAASVALVMALLPQPPLQLSSDKLAHILAFAVLAALASFAFPKRSTLLLLAGLSIFGAMIELLQTIPNLNRDPDVMDWVADTVAAAIVLASLRWRRIFQGRR